MSTAAAAVLAQEMPAVEALAQPMPAAATPESVPPRLYVGRHVYLDHCAACHGLAGQGSRLAPDLLARIGRMSRREFTRVLNDGYPGIENGPAPWATIAEVGLYVDELWDYLSARGSGAIGPGELAPARQPVAD